MFGEVMFNQIMFGDDEPDITVVIKTVFGSATPIGPDPFRSHADLLVVTPA